MFGKLRRENRANSLCISPTRSSLSLQSGATVTPRFFMLGRKIGNRCSDLLKLGETYTEIRQKYVTAFIFLLDL